MAKSVESKERPERTERTKAPREPKPQKSHMITAYNSDTGFMIQRRNSSTRAS